MAKNKRKGQKPKNVFHIASQKHFKVKSKAKPVTTNLKKITIVRDGQGKHVDQAFADLQRELAGCSMGLAREPVPSGDLRPGPPPPRPENRPVNVDEATRLMAQL